MRWVWPFFLILLHNAAGLPILVNADLITSMQGRSEGQRSLFVGDVKCLVNLTDGKFVTVIETCDQVRRLVDESEKGNPP